MKRAGAALTVLVTTIGALAASHGCGTPCADDRCSLSQSKPQVTRVDYTNKGSGSSATTGPTTTGPATGSATAGSGSATVAVAGSASAKPASGSGSATAAGSGSAATPVPPPVAATSWQVFDGDPLKMRAITKGTFPVNTTIKIEFVKTPDKTPFVITLEVRPPGGTALPEVAWNDCPETKIKCDVGAKTHSTKKAGQIVLQAGINWAITGVADESKSTLLTWTNNLSREVVSLRLNK